MRAFILAVTGLAIAVAACSSYGTSRIIEVEKPSQAVASVVIALPSPSLIAGQTQRASVTLKDASGVALTDRAILWYTSAASVAAVTDSGVVVGVAPGAATVSAVSEGVAGQAALTVIPPPPVPVAKVVVAINPTAVVVGQTAQATVALQDSNGNPLTDRAVTWQSGNPGVATVSGNGAVSAVAPGTATISATSEGKTASASLSVSAPAPVPVATVSVSPASSSLQVGATVQLSATTLDANGAALTNRVVGWSSANAGIASVNSNGLVSGGSVGTIQITASSEGKSSSATITVTAPAPAPVATVSVSPQASTLQVGATAQLSATMRDASGNPLTGRAVAWSSANPSIASVNSTSGVVTALAAGPATTITAISETKTGTATVSVQAPPPPPPPGSSNEPSGMTNIADRAFNTLEESPWYTQTQMSIVQDVTAPKSPSNVIRVTFPKGFAGGTSNGLSELAFPVSYRVLYISYWVKYSANWWGHLTGVNKHGYAWINNQPAFVMEAKGVGAGTLTPRPVLQNVVVGNGVYEPNLVPSAVLTRDQWHRVEYVVTANSAGAANGTIDWWLNGVHVGSAGGIQWSAGASAWHMFQLYPVWGGVGDVVPADQYIQWDHVYMSGKN